jgi:adenylate cyclase
MATGIAHAHLAARRFEQAIEWADRALHEQPTFMPSAQIKVVANAHIGRLDEARADAAELLGINPGFTITSDRARTAESNAPDYVELNVTGFRLAGLPAK